MINVEQIKKLRTETGISLVECKKALEQSRGDINLAKKILRKWGQNLATKKSEREAKEGIIESYIHPNKKIGVLLEISSESDFVAKSEEFKKLAHEICLQIAAMNPRTKNSLLSQPWIRDETRTIKDLIAENIAKFGENIIIRKFVRYQI